MENKNALVLCSGGLDSVVTAYYVKKTLNYQNLRFLFFDYGQRNLIAERRSAKNFSKRLDAEFIEISLRGLGKISRSLTNNGKAAKKIRRNDLKKTVKESEKWYVPCRNLVFVSYALSLAEANYLKSGKREEIFLGFKNEGMENYPDTSPEFVKLTNNLSKMTSKGRFKVLAPLINKDKEEVISIGQKLGVKLENTFSCYIGKRVHCGYCLSCRLRQEGFYWANIRDPTIYREKMKDLRLAD